MVGGAALHGRNLAALPCPLEYFSIQAMTELQTTTTLLGAGLTLVILYLLRRDHLYLRDALFWVTVALLSLIMGAFPRLVDGLASFAGVAYSPALLLLVAVLVLALRALMSDLALTQVRRDVRRLNQRIALIQAGKDSPEQEH